MAPTFNEKLKSARESKHLTQQQVADTINVTRQAVSQWENGKSAPDLETLKRLCSLYEITPNDLLLDKEAPISQAAEIDTEKSRPNRTPNLHLLESIGISFILLLSAQFAFVGILIPVCVFIWMSKTHRNHRLIYGLCFLCLCIGLYNSYVILDYIFWNYYSYSVTSV